VLNHDSSTGTLTETIICFNEVCLCIRHGSTVDWSDRKKISVSFATANTSFISARNGKPVEVDVEFS